jgi:EAL domain-containing protein (putative c-di-GMP-specific phosphodiesterase class I)
MLSDGGDALHPHVSTDRERDLEAARRAGLNGPVARPEADESPSDTWLAIGTEPERQRAAASLPLEALEANFERALHGIHMLFQPIVDADLRLFGFEALMRAESAVLPDPSALLDAAERLHRVERLGRTIRREVASRFAGASDEYGLVFVNLHALDLADRSLSSPYSPLCKLRHRVVLEITERASLAAVADARYRVAALREMGYRIAIDDLGAGHSRMNRFTLRDTDFVKLDMSLVRDLDKHTHRQRLVHSIISMCRDQGIRVVGEGIETAAERDTLMELGCDLLQGFFIARPSRQLAKPR